MNNKFQTQHTLEQEGVFIATNGEKCEKVIRNQLHYCLGKKCWLRQSRKNEMKEMKSLKANEHTSDNAIDFNDVLSNIFAEHVPLVTAEKRNFIRK